MDTKTIVVVFVIIAAILLFKVLFGKKKEELPIDNVRRPFTNDEKIKIAWQHYDKHGPHCAHCSSDEDMDFDHIVPLARGGHNGLKNMQILCGHHNSKKGARMEN